MLWIDVKYAGLLGSSLRNFKRKDEFLWNYSCNICGDSSKDKLKARGYVFRHKESLVVKCHNCGFSSHISALIRAVNTNLYSEYIFEQFKSNTNKERSNDYSFFNLNTRTLPVADNFLSNLKRITDLDQMHPARIYCSKRMIPYEKQELLFFAPRFKHLLNKINPEKYHLPLDDHPRLIIPFIDIDGKCISFQGRAFGNEIPRYQTIKLVEDSANIFGRERLDLTKPIYVTEGPIDSLFLDNAIAVAGSSVDIPFVSSIQSNAVIIFDNEPRSRIIVNNIKTMIDKNYKVFIWPSSIKSKDINDAVKAGIDIVSVISENIYSGASALLKLSQWKKC